MPRFALVSCAAVAMMLVSTALAAENGYNGKCGKYGDETHTCKAAFTCIKIAAQCTGGNCGCPDGKVINSDQDACVAPKTYKILNVGDDCSSIDYDKEQITGGGQCTDGKVDCSMGYKASGTKCVSKITAVKAGGACDPAKIGDTQACAYLSTCKKAEGASSETCVCDTGYFPKKGACERNTVGESCASLEECGKAAWAATTGYECKDKKCACKTDFESFAFSILKVCKPKDWTMNVALKGECTQDYRSVSGESGTSSSVKLCVVGNSCGTCPEDTSKKICMETEADKTFMTELAKAAGNRSTLVIATPMAVILSAVIAKLL